MAGEPFAEFGAVEADDGETDAFRRELPWAWMLACAMLRGCAMIHVSIVYRAHCWQACARFLLGWTLARWVNFNLQDLRGCGRVLWVPKNLKPVFGLFDCADSEHGFTEASQLRGAV